MKLLYRLTVFHRLLGLVILAITALVVMEALTVWSERTLLMQARQLSVRQTVEVAHDIIAHYHAQAAKGELSEEQAKKRALEVLRPLRYSGNEYFWVNNLSDIMVMHPIRPELENQNLSQIKDTTGKLLFVAFNEIVKKQPDGGFVDYMWPKPGSTAPVPKVSFVKNFAPWGWVVGSGVYVDTVDAIFMQRMFEALGTATPLALLLLLCGWAVSQSILRQIGAEPTQLNAITHQIARGDLSVEIPAAHNENSVLHGIRAMRESVTHIVLDVRRGAESVATASAQIAQGNQDLSSRTESQAGALEQTAASMEQLGSTVRQNADSARQANQLALNASSVAEQAGGVVSEVVSTMRDIDASSHKISDIIQVIDSIAFQTNILALNAAVEAARAGEQGRGFAVVAGEVRALAGRSADAAKEIKLLITDSVQRVEQGTHLVDKAGSTMEEVVSSIRRVTDIMGEISAASSEQSQGVSQIGNAITQMDQTTQQNAALVEEMAAAANSLRSQATQLVEAVATFRTDTMATHAPIVTTPMQSSQGAKSAQEAQGAKGIKRPQFPHTATKSLPQSAHHPARKTALPAVAQASKTRAAHTARAAHTTPTEQEWESF